MKHPKMALGLVALTSLMAVMASPAMATPRWGDCVKVGATEGHYSSGLCDESGTGWETKELEGTSTVTASGELELEDAKATGGATGIKCKGTSTGWIANPTSGNGQNGITTITATSCTFLSGKVGSCEESKGVTAKARNLPWGTRLIERETEVRDELNSGPKKEEGNGEPGWSVECTVAGILKITDTCEHQGNTLSTTPNRTTGELEEKFDKRTEEETMATCSVGSTNAGLARGTITSKLTNGNAFWTTPPGPPPTVANPRWGDCVKVGATEGHYSSGLCDESGTGWETKELEGTSTVTASGELELEDAKATGGATGIKCKGTSTGWIANPTSGNGQNGITTITATSCTFLSGKVGSCEESKGVTAKARNLPWGTRLIERETEVRDELNSGPKKEEGNGEPGWSVECTVAGILKITDTCEHQGNTLSTTPNRTTGELEEKFDKRTEEETMATCSVGSTNAGLARGTITSKLTNGNAFWTTPPGPPPTVANPRWGDCVKVGATEGHYSSGLCNESGTGWETKELEGTSTVTASGELELEDAKATGGATGIKCKGTSTGWIANPTSGNGQNGITTITATSCTFLSGKVGSCEESKGVTAKARNLPWGTRLIERETEVRDELNSGPKKEEGNGEPGWSVECTVAGILKITDTCEHQGNTLSTTPNRTTGELEEKFDKRTEEETMATCNVGGTNAGLARGTITSKLTNGNAFWILT